mmetsp:Transcript_244/g.832  ORF Transcript_244/g.832 Transcript_244/m.832 type:complete len:100 (+) Transcript_244:217-516(+)
MLALPELVKEASASCVVNLDELWGASMVLLLQQGAKATVRYKAAWSYAWHRYEEGEVELLTSSEAPLPAAHQVRTAHAFAHAALVGGEASAPSPPCLQP